jgi:hypothetical protein
MTTLNDLQNLNINVEVAAPEEYVDGNMPSLVPEGRYDLVITDWDVSRDYETKQPDGKAFILQTVVSGGEHDGKAVRNLRVWTATFERNGVRVSGLGDLIRAIDDTARFTNLQEAGSIIQRAQDMKTPIQVQLKWEAFDSEFYNENGGQGMVNKSPEQKELRKRATVKGMSNFRQAADGTYLPEVEGPSGNILEARLTINSYTPSSRRR